MHRSLLALGCLAALAFMALPAQARNVLDVPTMTDSGYELMLMDRAGSADFDMLVFRDAADVDAFAVVATPEMDVDILQVSVALSVLPGEALGAHDNGRSGRVPFTDPAARFGGLFDGTALGRLPV